MQLPDDKMQKTGLNVPLALLLLHVALPIGIVGKIEVSFTLTVNVTEPADHVAGFGVIVVVVP